MGFPWLRFLREAAADWSEDRIPRLSAALACYAVFSISPLLILVLNLASNFFGGDAVRGQLEGQLQGLMGDKAASVVQEMVRSTIQPRQSLFAAVTGIVTLLVGATALFAEMREAMCQIWHTSSRSCSNGGLTWLRSRLLGLVMVMAILALLVLSLIATGVFAFVTEHMPAGYIPWAKLWLVAGFLISIAGEVLLFAIMFKVLPSNTCPWRFIWGGAIGTTILFEAGKWGLGWYLGRESTASLYGAAGSVVLLLLWIYYSAMIVLTGAELTQAYSRVRHNCSPKS